MAQVLLAFDDVGLGVQLQQALESCGHVVVWDVAQATGPASKLNPHEAVVLSVDGNEDHLPELVTRWRTLDPCPGIVVTGMSPRVAAAANTARIEFVSTAGEIKELSDAINRAVELRFTAGMTPGLALAAIGMARTTSDLDDAIRIVKRSKEVDAKLVRAALRWHTQHYVAANDRIALLREHRALDVPEIEFTHKLDGTRTVQTLVKSGPVDPWHAARLLWALQSIGATKMGPEPIDQATPERRALVATRFHLRARSARLEKRTFYDVLEITPDANPTEIDTAFRQLSLRFGPQRTKSFDLSDLTELPEPMWKQITRAREIFHSMVERGRYNDWLRTKLDTLRSEWTIESNDARRAQESFAHGQAALTAGETHKAMGFLAQAARSHPNHPEFECGLAWARHRVAMSTGKDPAESARRERAVAEAALAGRRPWPRALVALALLSVADGDPDAARWHLREALGADPSLPAARQLLSRLGDSVPSR